MTRPATLRIRNAHKKRKAEKESIAGKAENRCESPQLVYVRVIGHKDWISDGWHFNFEAIVVKGRGIWRFFDLFGNSNGSKVC